MEEASYSVQFRLFANSPWEECAVRWSDFESAEDVALDRLWVGEWEVARVIKQTGPPDAPVTETIDMERKCPRWLPRGMG